MKNIDFANRVVVVTGAGGGLGKTYALELARRGCKVVVNDLGCARDGSGSSQSMAEQVVQEIKKKGGEAIANCDGVNTAAGGKAIVDAALKAYGKLDILIHNAGILRDRSYKKMTEEEWRAVINVHLDGAFYVSKPAMDVMRENNYGRIIFTTSVSGLFGNFGQANYGASKMGQVGLMNVLAIEGAKYGIKVNAISPVALTRMTEDLDRSGAPDVSRDPEHVTPAVIYLASEACETTATIIQAGHGFFGRIQTAYNPGVFLGKKPVTAEEFAENWKKISEMSELQIQTAEKWYLAHVYEKASKE